MAIEPLSIALKTVPGIQGVTRNGIENRVSPYADDLLIYVTHPLSAIPVINSILVEFGSYSGYKLNFSKSEFYPINAAASIITQTEIPFRLVPDGFKYLGVNITRKMSLIQDANFSPLLTKMRSDFQRWSSLHPLSSR